MVETIYEIKNKALQQLQRDVADKGVERIDGQMVDVVKDLAEAEKACWEAEYYRAVTEAMEGKQGYSAGYEPMGYTQARDSMGRYARRGYSMGHADALEGVRVAMQSAQPEERERMKQELRGMFGM